MMKQFIQMIWPKSLFSLILLALMTLDGHSAYQIPDKTEVLVKFGKSFKKELDPENISVLNWNIYKGDKLTFKPWFLTLAAGKDILIIQEMYLTTAIKTISATTNKLHFMATSFIDGDGIRTGVMTSAKVPAKRIEFQVSEKTEPVVNTPKVGLMTEYPIKGTDKTLLVVNIHAINFVENKWFYKQIDQLFAKIDEHAGPVIFSGDFNTWNKNRYYMLDQYCRLRGFLQATFLPDTRMTFNGNPLDHVIYSPDLEVQESKVHGNVDGSDHKPMTVKFRYIGN